MEKEPFEKFDFTENQTDLKYINGKFSSRCHHCKGGILCTIQQI